MTPEQRKAIALANARKRQAEANQMSQEQKPGQQAPDRFAGVQRTAQSAREGKYGLPTSDMARNRMALSMLGETAANVGDMTAKGVSAVASGINDLSGGRLGRAAGDVAQFVGSAPLPFTEKNLGEAATEAIQATGDVYGKFKQAAPETAEALEDVANISMVLPGFAQYGDDVVKGIAKTGKSLKRPEILPSDVVRKKASKLYTKADEIGGSLNTDFTQKYTKKLIRKSEKDPLVTKIRRAGGQDDAYANVIDILQDYSDEPLTFERAKNLDEALGQLAYNNVDNFGNVDSTGRQYLDMQMTLREMVDSASPEDFIGTSEAFETAKEARKYWQAQTKLRDVERIIENAERFDQPATAVRTGFRTLLRNAKKTKGYTPQEIKAMERAAKTGLVTDFFRLGGSGLGPIIAGVGGGVATGGLGGAAAALPAYALQSTSKGIATARQMGRARNVGRTISQGLSGTPTSNVLVEGARAAVPIAGALTPAAVSGLTKEQLRYIMSLPPAEAEAILMEMQQ